MPAAVANGVTLAFEDAGDPAAPAVLLVMGLASQLTVWPVDLVEALVARGFRVIRFDNRDIGLSTKFDSAGVADIATMMMRAVMGMDVSPPYTLDDMAADAVGLLDALGIARAHVVGASMGGMIAQLIAADHPTRVASLVSIMSTTGNRALPPARAEAMAALMARPDTVERDAVVAYGMKVAQVIGSPGYPADPERLRTRVAADFDRSFAPAGAVRQMAAIVAAPDRRAKLARIAVPATVIHGADDTLVPVEGGRDTAASIPGAELKVIAGMGHDLPLALVGEIADAIAATAARAA